MFSSTENKIAASELACLHVKTGSFSLALRVRLQRILDSANVLPCLADSNLGLTQASNQRNNDISNNHIRHEISSHLLHTMDELTNVLSTQIAQDVDISDKDPISKKETKRNNILLNTTNVDELWASVIRPQKGLKRKWAEVVDKFHARAYFGSEVNSNISIIYWY